MKNAICLVSLFVLSVACADPSIVVTSCTQDAATGLVTVDYTLTDGPAIVTAAFETNGVPVARKVHRSMIGDVNRLVSKSSGRLMWQPKPENGAFDAAAGELTAKLTARRPDNPPDYMVVRLDQTKRRFYYESADDLPFGVKDARYRRDCLLMRRIPSKGVQFLMGSLSSEAGRTAANERLHQITFTNDCYMGVFECTCAQYGRITTAFVAADVAHNPQASVGHEGSLRGWRSNSCRWPQNGHAVTSSLAIGKLCSRTGLLFDLPTEAIWEFAARGGSSASPDLDKCAWYVDNAGSTVHPVGEKDGNGFGLYDILGNVREDCLDTWAADNTVFGEVDPPGLTTEDRTAFVVRGGGYNSSAANCRLASRGSENYSNSVFADLGFRLWCALPDEK